MWGGLVGGNIDFYIEADLSELNNQTPYVRTVEYLLRQSILVPFVIGKL